MRSSLFRFCDCDSHHLEGYENAELRERQTKGLRDQSLMRTLSENNSSCFEFNQYVMGEIYENAAICEPKQKWLVSEGFGIISVVCKQIMVNLMTDFIGMNKVYNL